MHRVWLVEDNSDDALLVQRAFHGDAFHFEAVKSGEEALKKLTGPLSQQRDFNRPSLILVDLSLPGMNGLDLISVLKANPSTANIPIVILTGSERDEDAVESLKIGAIKFLRKPLTPLTVGEILNECLDK